MSHVLKPFKYLRVKTLSEAVSALSKYGRKAIVMAGGTDVLQRYKLKYTPEFPEVIIDLKGIPDLSYIKEEGGVLKIGSLTTLSDIAESSLIRSKYTALAEAADKVASPQIRNMGTIAGNICQDIRCWYYRAPNNYFNCLRKGGAMCYAMAGDNRYYHSIFGAVGGCVATNPSDTAPALVALDAKVVTNKRTIPIEEFFTVDVMKTTVLDPDEIITEIQIPTPPPGTKSKFIKHSIRKSIDFALVNCASAITSEGGVVKEARICLNAVYNLPYRATKAEEYLKGKSIDESIAEEASRRAVEDAVPLSMNRWKVEVAKALVKRAILACK
ncbi:molybdopterin dehydrogenase [archaeon]|nr:MAG: molybdopterin dehydrogenase [archaeon]